MKTAIITGGSRGIGSAIVRDLAARGVFTFFTYKSGEDEAKILQDELNGQGLNTLAIQLDITDKDACQNLVNDFYKKHGAPDILVNNAGITQDSLLFSMREEQWSQVIDTNLNGLFNITQTVVFHMMRAKKGRIINLASISGISGIKGQCNYSATKAAVIGFTKALAREASPLGIAVNAVAPGGVQTAMTEAISPEAFDEMVRDIPMKRLCSVHEVSNVVTYLALDSPLYLTGSTIVLDGGLGSL
ncbi:MAG: 3-oxoacyl-ACP reductase FabG [Eubacteriales bacterium]|nr:3-oxoacyl-ACP reductase FabG [Eubacteriales bacterium]